VNGSDPVLVSPFSLPVPRLQRLWFGSIVWKWVGLGMVDCGIETVFGFGFGL
jgi:hypothetical protein